MSGEASVSLWVKAEPFSYGAFHIAPHPRLNFNNIKKIVIYAKNKGQTGFPRISYSVWRHIACNKLHLSEELAWLYFTTCHLLNENTSPVERLEWDFKYTNASDPEKEVIKNKCSVGTLKFVLFLYIQQLHKVSLKASLVAGEEWPTRSSSPDLDSTGGRSTPRGNNKQTLDDHSHMVFMQNNLHEILELLVEHDNYAVSQADLSLTTHAIEALGSLIAGSVDRCKTLLPLQDIAVLQTVQQRSGFSKLMKTFSLRLFQSWVKDSLVQNPFGISACIASGKRLSWPMGVEESKDGKESQSKRGRIATNAHAVPKEHMRGNKIIIMSQVGKQTVSRSSGTLENSSVKIHRCHSAYLYLLSPLRSVTIEKCRNTTVVLGPVETVVYLSHCESVTLISPCRTVTVSGCTLCTLHILSPNPPVLLSSNDSILLAPYHTYYPKLEEHMAEVGIGPDRNMWDQPLCIGPDHREEVPVWEVLSPSEFYTFHIPFEMEGPTKSIPGGLPSKYQRAISQRHKQTDSWQKAVKDAGLTREQRKEFQGLVESRFHAWLADMGHKRELDSLVVPQTAKK